MKFLTSLYLVSMLLLSINLSAQTSVWDSWEADVVRSLYTSRGTPYLNEEEQKVILFMNMARHNGPLFAETFLTVYVEENQVEKSSYLRSLYQDLNKASGLVPFKPEEDLTAVAQGHATRSGETGHVGHKDMQKRFAPLRGNPYNAWGENCSYGFEEAISIVITLLIDEGIKDMGHRKNILNEEYNSVGVAIRPHKSYRVNCVIDFGKKNRSNLNRVPY
ncbi:MAG: CAP domain-containing protein [Bacteroidales bacterium]|nr:CAP domain-containing protein [Bacteroidales bacterium]